MRILLSIISLFLGSTLSFSQDGTAGIYKGVTAIAPIHFTGRFYAETNNRWVGTSANYGLATENQNQNLGTGVDPNVVWNELGQFVDSNKTISTIAWGGRVNNTEITSIEFRVYFQYGDYTNIWNSAAETTRELIYQGTHTITDTGMFPWIITNVDFTTSRAGRIVIAVKPSGTITARRYMYLDGVIK